MFKRAIGKPTAEEQSRQDRARERGCIACLMFVVPQPNQTEINHQTKCGRQISQDATEALCAWHHRSICVPGITSREMTREYGPSLAKNPREFVRIFGDNAERLKFQNELIGVTERIAIVEKKRTSLSSKKVLPRQAA